MILFCTLLLKINSWITPLKLSELNSMQLCQATISCAFSDVMGIREIFWLYISYREIHSGVWCENCKTVPLFPRAPPTPTTERYSKSNPWDTGTSIHSLLLKLWLWDTNQFLSSPTITSESYILWVVPVIPEWKTARSLPRRCKNVGF